MKPTRPDSRRHLRPLAQGGRIILEADSFHPGQFRLTIGQGGACETVVLDRAEAQQLSSLLLGVLFDTQTWRTDE